jgi:hypothetical protein
VINGVAAIRSKAIGMSCVFYLLFLVLLCKTLAFRMLPAGQEHALSY